MRWSRHSKSRFNLSICEYHADRQFVKVIRHAVTPLQAVIVQREPFDEVFAQAFGGPPAELDPPRRANPIADGQDHIKVVMVDQPPDLPGTLGLNYSILSNSCLRQKLSVLINAFNMMVYGVAPTW